MGCVQSQNPAQHRMPDHSALPKEYSAEVYSNMINDALKSGDNDFFLRSLHGCSPEQRKEISALFQSTFGKTILKASSEMKIDQSELVVFTAELLLTPKMEFLVGYIHKLLSCAIVREATLIRLLMSCEADMLKAMSDMYRRETGTVLSERLRAKCASDVGSILSTRVERWGGDSASTGEDPHSSPEVCGDDLVDAVTSGDLFQGRRVFHRHMSALPLTTLRDVLEHFLKRCQRDVEVEIERHYPEGSARDGLCVMAAVVRNPCLHLATRVHELLKKEDAESRHELLVIILSQTEEEIKDLKQTYKATFFDMLAHDVREEIREEWIQRFILKVVK